MHNKKPNLCDLLGIEFPLIMAPMFLVSNEDMVVEALKSGITAAIPALNYRTTAELRTAIQSIKSKSDKPFGINLIVNRSNFYYNEQLNVCLDEKVAFIITSLGSPEETIEKAHQVGVKVFCDVTDLNYAKKVDKLGADAIIAVNSRAGGHAGPHPYEKLVPELVANCNIPIISAGGVGTGSGINDVLKLGAAGLSMGTIFIASKESPVSQDYKNACVDYKANDVVMTTKLSGTPCTVINTPYVQKVGTRQNLLERILNKNKRIKKWVKAMVFYRGMKKLQQAAFNTTYQTVWCAGPAIEYVHSIRSVSEIIAQLKQEYYDSQPS